MRKLGWVAVCLAVGCGGGTSIERTVGVAGGSLNSPEGTRVDIPGGALGSDTNVSINPTPNAAAPTNTVLVGVPQTFGPEGAQFAKPVTVTLPFDAAKLPADTSAANIVIYSAPAGSTAYVPSEVTTVADAGHVSTTTSHFSVFVAAVRTAAPGCTVTCTKSTSGCGCTSTCDGVAYALECNTLGACSCKTGGSETSIIETSACASETPATLFTAYSRTTNGCGYPGTQPAS